MRYPASEKLEIIRLVCPSSKQMGLLSFIREVWLIFV